VSVADAICATLESYSLHCWIAPRDVLPGQIWLEALFDAIDNSPVVVFVASANSYGSGQVLRELENAASNNAIIVPFRIDFADIPKRIIFLIGTRQWLNAQEPPLEKHLQQLADTIRRLLGTPPPPLRCHKCGVELRPSARFCHKCGTPAG